MFNECESDVSAASPRRICLKSSNSILETVSVVAYNNGEDHASAAGSSG